MSDRVKLWIARGFDTGLFPIAPGTIGTLVGVLWTLVLIAPGNLFIFATGCALGVPVSVWLCGEAEKILRSRDPGPVVLDEIIAVPICCVSWLIILALRIDHWPGANDVFESGGWIFFTAVFILFRTFDILKPAPVRQSQDLAGGLGVTIDDVLAAVYVNIVMVPVVWFGLPKATD